MVLENPEKEDEDQVLSLFSQPSNILQLHESYYKEGTGPHSNTYIQYVTKIF